MLAGERAAKGRLSAQLRPVGGRRASVRVASGRACLLLRALSAAWQSDWSESYFSCRRKREADAPPYVTDRRYKRPI